MDLLIFVNHIVNLFLDSVQITKNPLYRCKYRGFFECKNLI